MKNTMIDKKNKKLSLVNKFSLTIFGLIIALTMMWFLFYTNMNRLLNRYVTSNLEHVSEQIILEMEPSLLEMEEIAFELSANKSVIAFLTEDETVDFVDKAGAVDTLIQRLSRETSFPRNTIVYNTVGDFFRFEGTLKNTSIKKLIREIERNGLNSHIQISLENTEYIGYISIIYDGTTKVGTSVMLVEESAIHRVFSQAAYKEDVKVALSADDRIVISSDKVLLGQGTDEMTHSTPFVVSKRIGFTPFEIVVIYENANRAIRLWFIGSLAVLAAVLLIILSSFIYFWRRNFFVPIQAVISGVENLDMSEGEEIPLTGLEHFDGLVKGINETIARVEQKEKEIYEARLFLHEAELTKQKALIVSLKKQISAHFTVNVLSIIKALSANGENEKAGILCDGLSFLLRYANAGDSFISVMDEFFVLQKYVDIMEVRYPGRFTVDIDVVDELDEIIIPRMLLQPIVENSIVHGIIESEDYNIGNIKVYCIIQEKLLTIVVEDDGKGMDDEKINRLIEQIKSVDENTTEVEGLSHVALINIQRRIISYFGKQYGLTVESQKGKGTKVTVCMPLNKNVI